MNSNPNTPVAGLVERLRNPKKWCCIFEHEGQMRHGTTDAPYKAADRIEQLEADNRRLYERLVETQMNAHKWMEAHDKLHSGKPYEFPKPADLPETVAQLEAGKRALESRIAATIKVIEEGYPGTSKTEQCKHGHYGFEECIACYDEALLSAISNPSPVKGTE